MSDNAQGDNVMDNEALERLIDVYPERMGAYTEEVAHAVLGDEVMNALDKEADDLTSRELVMGGLNFRYHGAIYTLFVNDYNQLFVTSLFNGQQSSPLKGPMMFLQWMYKQTLGAPSSHERWVKRKHT